MADKFTKIYMCKDILDFETKLDKIRLQGLADILCGSALHYTLRADKNLYHMHFSIIRALFRIIRASVTKDIMDNKKNSAIVMLFSNSYKGRADYMRWFEAITELLPEIQVIQPFKRTVCLNNLKYIIYFFKWMCQTKEIKDLKRRWIYLSILYEAFIDYEYIIHRLSSTAKIIAVVSDTHLIDSMVVQYCNRLFDTATFQHGIYLNHSDSYTYSKSRFFLTHGEFSKQQALKAGLNSSNLLSLGMPGMVNEISGNKLQLNDCKEIAIFLSGDIFSNDDIKMLEIILKWNSAFGYRLKVKPHPGYGIDSYHYNKWNEFILISEKESAINVARNSLFSVTNGSTLFAELSVLLLPVIDYRGVADIYINIKNFGFTNLKEFTDWVNMLIQAPDSFEKRELENKDLFCSDNVKQNYYNFFIKYITNTT